jgi:putative transposase
VAHVVSSGQPSVPRRTPMILTYKYRLLPTKQQHRALEAILESQRQLYNAALQERIDAYRKAKIKRTYIDQTKALTEWRRSDPDAAHVPVTLQRDTLKRVDNAYEGFFRRVRNGGERPGFPRFRGKGRFKSFGLREFGPRVGIAFHGNRIGFKGVPGTLRLHLHRPIPAGADIVNCTFSRDGHGWTAGLAMKLPTPSPSGAIAHAVGVDVGITTFAAMSDGTVIPSLRAARKAERQLRLSARSLSRKRIGSNGRRKARTEYRRCHALVARRRNDHLHKASAAIIAKHDLVVVEALNLKALTRSRLAKDIYDASWSMFISMLRYKAERAGARLVEVNPKNTTQDCSGCGVRVPKGLGDRLHHCFGCGLSIDRDLNAARNILIRAGAGPGLRNVAGGGKRAGGNLFDSRALYEVDPEEMHPTLLLY